VRKEATYSIILMLTISNAYSFYVENAQDKYFDTSFLSQYNIVQQELINDFGTQKVNFYAADETRISGLFIKRPEANYTLISCPGFFPGRKEGMATLIKLIPLDCNLLLYDARSQGESRGSLISSLHRYGLHEYLDVIAAIEFVHHTTQKPIIIHGLCAGAFHATRALHELRQNDLLDHFRVVGLIFDSGLNSIPEALAIPGFHIKDKLIPSLLAGLYQSKEAVKQSFCYQLLCTLITPPIAILTASIGYHLKKNHNSFTLMSIFEQVPCPIFFIHAENDRYTPISEIKKSAHVANNGEHTINVWWIEQSTHACHHLIHKKDYKNKISEFLVSVLN